MEPTTPTATVAVSASLGALLAGAYGQVTADVMLVLLSSIAGTIIALSGTKTATVMQALSSFFGAVFTAMALSWAIASIVAGVHPSLSSSHVPTIVAFLIGSQSTRLGAIATRIFTIFEKRIGSKRND